LIALPGTPSEALEAELVDVGYGLLDEIGPGVDGKIVMARSDTPNDHDRFVHRIEKYAKAHESGAIGFVFRNHVKGYLPPTGEIGKPTRPGPILAVGVSAEVGTRLARIVATESPTVRLNVDCRNGPATSPNVEAVLGPGSDREVLVTAHVDAHDVSEGANDNGVGCALLAETARLLTQVEDQLETAIRVIAFGAEEIGAFGSTHWVESRDLDTVKGVVNIDGAGGFRTPLVRTKALRGCGKHLSLRARGSTFR